MASTTTSISIASRIEWCRQQSMHASSPREITGWDAEEDGLWDALLNRDHSNQYQQGPPDVLARYVMGLKDGHALKRTAAAGQDFTTHAQGKQRAAQPARFGSRARSQLSSLVR